MRHRLSHRLNMGSDHDALVGGVQVDRTAGEVPAYPCGLRTGSAATGESHEFFSGQLQRRARVVRCHC